MRTEWGERQWRWPIRVLNQLATHIKRKCGHRWAPPEHWPRLTPLLSVQIKVLPPRHKLASFHYQTGDIAWVPTHIVICMHGPGPPVWFTPTAPSLPPQQAGLCGRLSGLTTDSYEHSQPIQHHTHFHINVANSWPINHPSGKTTK